LLLGVFSAVYQDRSVDYAARLFGVLGLSVPSFWLGTLLIVVPAVTIGYMPPLSYVSPFQDLGTNVRQFLAPCLALGWALSASVMRMTRSQMLEVLRDDYIRTARAKGLRGTQVVLRHALKNALIPVVTITGVQVGFLLGGTVVVEQVYGLPGVGMGTLDAVMLRDYPIIQTNVLFLTVAFVFINLVVDLAYGWLDPRVRYA
ncbi:MAG: ABC transporter permease, partial [Chloroflexota bacterium]